MRSKRKPQHSFGHRIKQTKNLVNLFEIETNDVSFAQTKVGKTHTFGVEVIQPQDMTLLIAMRCVEVVT